MVDCTHTIPSALHDGQKVTWISGVRFPQQSHGLLMFPVSNPDEDTIRAWNALWPPPCPCNYPFCFFGPREHTHTYSAIPLSSSLLFLPPLFYSHSSTPIIFNVPVHLVDSDSLKLCSRSCWQLQCHASTCQSTHHLTSPREV